MAVRATYYARVKLGPKRSLTPEGFLLCQDVPLARTGLMFYGPDETPIAPAKGDELGAVRITRGDDDLFNPITLGSANGKSVTINHPDEDVVPSNVKDLEVGVCIAPRRGEGALDDLMLGDLLLKAPDGIKAVQEQGLSEISLGYDADYEETGPGEGRQTNIIINHIALVEEGRCGPRCAIGDQKPQLTGETTMKTKNGKVVDFLMRAFKAKDTAEVEALANEVKDEMGGGDPDDGGTHIHLHTGEGGGDPGASTTQDDDQLQQFMQQNASEHGEFRAQIAALQQQVQALTGSTGEGGGKGEDDPMPAEAVDELPEDLREEASKAKDSAFFRDSFQDTIALAEILAPGISIPVYDSKAKPGATFKKICGFRRQALDTAYALPDNKALIDQILGGRKLDTQRMTCDAVRTLFRSAAAMKRVANNTPRGAPAGHTQDNASQAPLSIADVNRKNAEYWATH